MSKCKNCGSRMLKGYLKLDEETSSKIWVCPKSNYLHLELKESDLFFYCARKGQPKKPKKTETTSEQRL